MTSWEQMAHVDISRSDKQWEVQFCPPRDYFDGCTRTIPEWLVAEDPAAPKITSRWLEFINACALIAYRLGKQGGLRQEPRIGYDPAKDQPVFIFKASNNGSTFLVSPFGVSLGEEDQEYAEYAER